jgi:hypothetical protein
MGMKLLTLSRDIGFICQLKEGTVACHGTASRAIYSLLGTIRAMFLIQVSG